MCPYLRNYGIRFFYMFFLLWSNRSSIPQVSLARFSDENVPPTGEDRGTIYVVLGLTDNSWGNVDDVQLFAVDGNEATAVLVSFPGLHPMY